MVMKEYSKLIVITGTNKGLGREFILQLLSKNYLLCEILRNKSICGSNKSKNFISKKLDFNQFELNIDFKEYIDKQLNEIIFINNAATLGNISFIKNLSNKDFLNAQNVNVLSPIKIIKKLLDLCLIKKINLRILNITSGASKHAYPGWSLYCSTKSSVRMLLDCLSLENENVTIKHIDPGVLDTSMQRIIRETNVKDFPLRDCFIKLKNENKLKSPQTVAKEILTAENLI
ncbi:MAG: SDR family NAD(P)-dependent oxidoreductase [bacterium]